MESKRKQIAKALEQVIDPEMYISIVDLGLLYNIIPHDQSVEIIMTLTTLGCPLFPVIEKEIIYALEPLGYTKNTIKVVLNFDEPWTFDFMSEEAKAILGV